MRAFSKDILRSIKNTAGRFTAILLIVALGSGFYAGLRMSGGAMRMAGNAWVDGTQLYDLELISTLGWSEEGIEQVAEADGVEAVMPAKSCDVMAEVNDTQVTVRISTIPDAASQSWSNDGTVVSTVSDYAGSDDDEPYAYLNRPVLAEGAWPTAPDECVVSADCITRAPIEVGDEVTVLYGTEDLDGVLVSRTFTVTGLVHSSTYITNASLGTTSIGNGDINQCMFVTEDAFDEDRPYTELYCAVLGARSEFAGGEGYWSIVDRARDGLDALAPVLAEARYAQLHDEAQAEIDDGAAELADAREEADVQIADAEGQLASAREELESGQAQVDSSRQQIADGTSQLEAGRAQLDDARTQLDAGRQQIADGKAQLEAARVEMQAASEQFAQAEAAWQSQRTDLIAQKDDLQAALAALEQIPEEMRTPEQQAQVAQLRAGIAEIDAGIAQGDAQIQTAKDELAAGNAQIEAQAAQLAQAESELAAQEAQVAQAEAELDARAAQLEDGRAQLASAEDQLASGWRDYESGAAELESQRAQAEAELADAEAELADAQAQLDELEVGEVYVLDRTKNIGVRSFLDDAARIDSIASIFPLFFFLVAALVALTTMTRMVDEERQTIGTYKAIGYSRAKITSKYLVYAATASTAGAVLGIGVLSQVLPVVIMKAYAIIYNAPIPPLPIAPDPKVVAVSAGAGIGITIISTLAAAVATLREKPAALMLPRAPKAGRRILIERIGPLWRRFSFSWKCTARNIFRYRRRLWMTLIGIAGCTALLLTGFGLHDSIWDIIDKQYNKDGGLVNYTMLVTMDDDASEGEYAEVERVLAEEEGASIVRGARIDVSVGSAAEDPFGVRITVPEDPGEFCTMIIMRDRLSSEPVPFDENSVVLSEKLANLLGVGVGDTVELYRQDDIGNAVGDPHPVVVTGITENYVGNEAYLGAHAYADAFGASEPAFTSLYVPGDPTQMTDQALVDELLQLEGVETVSTAGEVINTYRTLLQSVNAIVIVLVLAAAALCAVVLYNLANINITERRREIASLKVLGFTKREVHMYLYREIMLLVLIGAALGLMFGTWLEGFVVVTAEVDYVMFGREIHALSYLLAFGCTVAFSVFVLLLLGRKIDAIPMAESLKSVE